jgi:tetratricopeptide (TPR) repeat protein
MSSLVALLGLTAWNLVDSGAVDQARTDYARKDFAAGLCKALDHLDRQPWSTEARHLAALCLSRLDFAAAAESFYRRSGALKHDEALVRAEGIMRANQRERAVQAFQDILARWPNDPTALQRLGGVLLTMERWDQAADAAAKLAQIPDRQLIGYTMLALACHHDANYTGAIEASEQVLRLDPELTSKWVVRETFLGQLAEDLAAVGRYPEARQQLERLLQSRDDPAAWAILGAVYRQEGRREEAKRCLEHSLSLNARLLSAWLGLARLALDQNAPEQAVQPLERARQLAPESYAVAFLLAQTYQRLGRSEEARGARARLDAIRKKAGSPSSGMNAPRSR